MFFSVFWTVYIPIVTIISAGIGDWLTHSLRQRRAHAATACRQCRAGSLELEERQHGRPAPKRLSS